MNAYIISLYTLGLALVAHSIISGIAFERFFHRTPESNNRQLWLALAIGSLLLGLQHGYSIELALKTGIYDLRQALLAGSASLLFVWALLAFNRRA